MKANLLRLAILAILAGSVYAQEKTNSQPATMAAPESTAGSGAQENAGQPQEQHMMQADDSQHMNDMGHKKKDHKMKKEKMKKHDGNKDDSLDQYDPMKGNWG